MRTNFAKIDKATGKVNKREDGKVLKPDGWTPPELAPFIKKNVQVKILVDYWTTNGKVFQNSKRSTNT